MSIQPESDSGGGGVQGPTEQGLSTGDIHFTLSNCRRRFLIRYLSREKPTTVKELSRAIAAWENETPAEELSYDDRKTVYTALLQTHLPKLDEMGIVEYDASRKRVRLTDRADQLRPYLELERDEGPDDGDESRHYSLTVWSLLAIATVGVLFAQYSAMGLEAALLTALSFGTAAGVSVGIVLLGTDTVDE